MHHKSSSSIRNHHNKSLLPLGQFFHQPLHLLLPQLPNLPVRRFCLYVSFHHQHHIFLVQIRIRNSPFLRIGEIHDIVGQHQRIKLSEGFEPVQDSHVATEIFSAIFVYER